MGSIGRGSPGRPGPSTTALRPRSAGEVADAVRSAAERGRRVRALGSGSSTSGIADVEDLSLDLSALADLRYCDPESGTVTVGAGVTLRRLNDLLAGAGLALEGFEGPGTRTLGGAVSVGGHGTGEARASIASAVTGLEVVTGDGSLVTCSPAQRSDLWSAARVGLGALGVVTAVTLRCVPIFALRVEEAPMALDELGDRFDELAGGCDHFEARWYPHTRTALTRRCTRLHAAEGLDRLPAWREWLGEEVLPTSGSGWALRVGARRRSLAPLLNRLSVSALAPRTYTDLSHKVLTARPARRVPEMEMALPRLAAVTALREVVEAIGSSDLRIALPVGIRVSPADDVPLSGAYGRDSAHFAFQAPAGEHGRYFGLVSEVLDPYRSRPHWGKVHGLGAQTLRGRYPLFDAFLSVRDEVDPAGVFSNSYLDRVLGPPPGRPPTTK